MTGEATAAKESTGGRREQCNIVAMPETSPARKTSTCHKTVRSGTIYDFDMQERRRESLERAERLKAELGDEPITGTDDRIAYRFVKRVFDFAFSAAVLVLLSWLFVIIAILVKVDDPKGPVFFKQTRVGKNGREFEMLKFRSMCVDAEEKLADLKELNEKTGPVFKIAEDPRITRVGKWLRKLSLDELPQFINVLRSDMSVVGPRPALPNEVAAYNDYQRQRLLVKPGMTCHWQTRRNRDSITFDEWVDLDLWHGHVEFPRPKCGDFGIEPLAYAADLRRRQPVDSHPLRYALDLARRNPVGVHLGHSRRHRLVRPAVSLQHPLGEIGSAAQLRDAQRYLAGRRHQPALAVAVAAVGAALAGHVGLLVHDRVEGRFEQRPGERLQVERFSSCYGHVSV